MPLWEIFRKLVRRRGWQVALLWLLAKVMARVSSVRMLLISVHRPEGLPADDCPAPAGIDIRVLQAGEVGALCGTDGIQVDADFLRSAAQRRDECTAAFDGARLVSFSWNSTTLAPLSAGWLVGAGPQCVYGYKTATLPDYRGRGLSTCLILHQHREAFANGKIVVAYTDATNDRALVSAARLGRPRIGLVVMWGKGADIRMWISPTARQVGFTIRRDPGEFVGKTVGRL